MCVCWLCVCVYCVCVCVVDNPGLNADLLLHEMVIQTTHCLPCLLPTERERSARRKPFTPKHTKMTNKPLLWNEAACDVQVEGKIKNKIKNKNPLLQQVLLSLALICSPEQQMILFSLARILFSFICLTDINYIFIYRICTQKETQNVGGGKLIKY